jgi:hypothetical protein
MNDRTDWLYRKDGRQVMYMCVRSLECSQGGWRFKASAIEHRREHCRSVDTSFAVDQLLDGLKGAERLPVNPRARGGVRAARNSRRCPASHECEQPHQPIPSHPEQEYEAASGPAANSRSQGEHLQQCSSRLRGDAPDWGGNHFSPEHGDRWQTSSSAEIPHTMFLRRDKGSDDEEMYAGPLVDRREVMPADVMNSEASGGSIDLEDIFDTDEGHACDNAVGDRHRHIHACVPQEPDYALLQRRLVEHMTEYSLPAREARRAKQTTGWAQAANKGLTNLGDSITVRDYCFDQLSMYRSDVQSRTSIDAHLRYNAFCLQRHAPDSDPAGIRNCYPPSVAAAMAVLGVPLLEWYEVHFCGTGCMHWWFYMPNIADHYRRCSLKSGCCDCTCPHCGKCRFVKDKLGVHGAARCWFFFDCLQTKVLDPDWSSVVLNTQAKRDDPNVLITKSIFTQEPAPEYKRLTQNLPAGTKVE